MPRARGLFGREDDQNQVLFMLMYGHQMAPTDAPCPSNALHACCNVSRYFVKCVGVHGGLWGWMVVPRAHGLYG